MGFSWNGIVNTALRAVTVSKADISKLVGVAGKDVNAAIKIFVKVEPVAVTALTPFFPEGAVILNTAYVIAEKVEGDLTASGATKLQMATGILNDAVIPTVVDSLAAAGKTVDTTALSAVVPTLFNAIVAENNAQAGVTALLSAAAANKTIPDAAELAAAENAVALAVAAVKTLGTQIQAAITSVAPVIVTKAA